MADPNKLYVSKNIDPEGTDDFAVYDGDTDVVQTTCASESDGNVYIQQQIDSKNRIQEIENATMVGLDLSDKSIERVSEEITSEVPEEEVPEEDTGEVPESASDYDGDSPLRDDADALEASSGQFIDELNTDGEPIELAVPDDLKSLYVTSLSSDQTICNLIQDRIDGKHIYYRYVNSHNEWKRLGDLEAWDFQDYEYKVIVRREYIIQLDPKGQPHIYDTVNHMKKADLENAEDFILMREVFKSEL